MPDDVFVQGSLGSVQRQVGNAVPSLLGEVLGRAIREQILGQKPRASLKRLPVRAPSTPRAERVAAVPEKYLHREGCDTAHPGTGRGRGAEKRDAQVSA
jgi:DNA (cytosine-5)-methyltransferase 1